MGQTTIVLMIITVLSKIFGFVTESMWNFISCCIYILMLFYQ